MSLRTLAICGWLAASPLARAADDCAPLEDDALAACLTHQLSRSEDAFRMLYRENLVLRQLLDERKQTERAHRDRYAELSAALEAKLSRGSPQAEDGSAPRAPAPAESAATQPPKPQSMSDSDLQQPRSPNASRTTATATPRQLGALELRRHHGRLVLSLPEDVLFPSASASLRASGRRVLRDVAQVLGDFPDFRFQVEGHTDAVPIATAAFPSNWELSSARALSVLHLLIRQGVSPGQLSAAGYADTMPLATNSTAEGRAKNRRIELSLTLPD